MHTVEALDNLILFRQKPDSLLRRLMATEEAVRVAAQGELVALAVENGLVTGRKKGRIELEYYGTEDLNALLEALEKLGKR